MTLATEIPEDIIEEIISYLVDDIPTLKSCNAAHSLFLPGRKHIFSTVRLYQSSDIRKLHSLVNQSPDIATLISTLHVHLNPEEFLFSVVLPSLSHLRNLAFGRERHSNMNWRTLPLPLKTAFEEQIKLPTLQTLHFASVLDLPISIIPLAAHVKVLTLNLVRFADRDARHQVWGHPNPMQVESIHMFSSMANWVCPPLLAPHLRRCTIRGNSLGNHLAMQKIFAATEPEVSIQDLTWLEYRGNDSYIDPTVLSHLQCLTFITWKFDEDWFAGIAPMWSSMAELLRGVSLNILEEFSVTVRSDSDRYLFPSAGEGDMCLGATGSWWYRLDALLGDSFRTPKLRSVNFSLDITGSDPSVSDEGFALLIGKQLPLLQRAGILSTRLCRGSAGAAVEV